MNYDRLDASPPRPRSRALRSGALSVVASIIAAIAIALALGLGIPALLTAQDNKPPPSGSRPLGSDSAFVPNISAPVLISTNPMAVPFSQGISHSPDVAVSPFDPNVLITVFTSFSLDPPCTFSVPLQRTSCPTPANPTYGFASFSTTNDDYTSPAVFNHVPVSLVTGVSSFDANSLIEVGPLPLGNGRFTFADGQSRWYHMATGNLRGIYSTAPNEQIIMRYSDDNGATWSLPAIVQTPTNNSELGANRVLNLQRMSVDVSAHSRYFGCVYITSSAYPSDFSSSKGVLLRSCDGSLSWTLVPFYALTGDAYNNEWNNMFPASASTRDGTVHISGSNDDTILYWRSTNGGQTFEDRKSLAVWTNAGPVAEGTYPIVLGYPGSSPRLFSSPNPRIASASNGQSVYIAWNTCTQVMEGADVRCVVRLAQSHNNGIRWSTQTLVDVPGHPVGTPTVATSANGDRVVVTFYMWDREFPIGTPSAVTNDVTMALNFVFSLDSGKTFTAPAPVSPNFDPNWALRKQFTPYSTMADYTGVSVDSNGDAHVVWADTTLGAPCQPYWDYVNGVTPPPFDIFVACPANNTGRIDVWYSRIQFIADPVAGEDLNVAAASTAHMGNGPIEA